MSLEDKLWRIIAMAATGPPKAVNPSLSIANISAAVLFRIVLIILSLAPSSQNIHAL